MVAPGFLLAFARAPRRGGRGHAARYAAWSAREIELQALATLAALAQNSTAPSAAHFLKSHQLLVQKFAADRDRQRFSLSMSRACGLICANVDGITRRRKRLSGIRCRIENCVRSFTAVNLNHVPPDAILVCAGARLLSVRAIITELPALVIRTLQPIEMR